MNFQSSVTAKAVLLIALVKKKWKKNSSIFEKKNEIGIDENQTKTRGFHVRVPRITLSMFY